MFNPSGEKIAHKTSEPKWKKSIELQREEDSLKKIVEKNFKERFSEKKKIRPDLIDNFHWVIMRVRRQKKLTQEQLAVAISEPEAVIKMAEQGILPEKDYTLIKKIENFLGIILIKDEAAIKSENTPAKSIPLKELSFEPDKLRRLTISDLRRIKEEKRNPKSFSDFAVDFDEELLDDEDKENHNV